jgi:uncharacterized membrane protein YeaQ/YmgE (transglycosylase-associated protein family)
MQDAPHRRRAAGRAGSRQVFVPTQEDTLVGIIGWLILGLIAGAIAKALHKGNEPGGLLGTLVVGVLGAILGGLIASAIGVGAISSFFSIGTWLIAIGGAFLLLVVYNAVTGTASAGGGDRTAASGY